jgi:tRNA threonylcarbamoyladenosine biosynthesis protein TsaB
MVARHRVVSPEPASGPRLLALCSATRTASVALLEGDKISLEHAAVTSRHQSESLLPLVDRVLRERKIGVTDLDGFGISIGPGSFTSLRIGLATLKGLSFGTKIPVAPVSTLWALAAQCQSGSPETPIIAMLNAQRGEVYAAAFGRLDRDASPGPEIRPLVSLLPELVYNSSELAEILPAKCMLVGDGAAVVADLLVARLGSGVQIAESPTEPSAGAVGLLAAGILARGEGVHAADLAPRYVRRAEAEVTRTAQRFEAPAG